MEKLNDHQLHSSKYIESRIGEYPIGDFNDLTGQRILLEEMEIGGVTGRGFLTEFIENRIKDVNFKSFSEEMEMRQKLADCEMHTTPYVARRIGEYEFEDIDVPFAVIEDVPIFPGCESVAKSQRRACFQEQMNKHIRKNFRYRNFVIFLLANWRKHLQNAFLSSP